jgi:hypothetical protein
MMIGPCLGPRRRGRGTAVNPARTARLLTISSSLHELPALAGRRSRQQVAGVCCGSATPFGPSLASEHPTIANATNPRGLSNADPHSHPGLRPSDAALSLHARNGNRCYAGSARRQRAHVRQDGPGGPRRDRARAPRGRRIRENLLRSGRREQRPDKRATENCRLARLIQLFGETHRGGSQAIACAAHPRAIGGTEHSVLAPADA